MIQYKIIPSIKLKDDFLKGYVRYHETTRVKYLENNQLLEKKDHFIESWNDDKLISVIHDMKYVDGINIFAYDKKQVVGFCNIDTNSFNGYMNMPYIHVDQRYRGRSIGKNLVLLASKCILDLKVEKIYISAHPSVEAISFYQKLGFKLATYINQELYEKEPLDIQMERQLDYIDIAYRKIDDEFQREPKLSAKTLISILPRVYKYMPKRDDDYLQVCRTLLKEDKRYYFSIATLLLKKRGSVIDKKYIDLYIDTMQKDIRGWGQVDQYCYRVLGPIFNSDYSLFPILKEWSFSINKDVRRASIVSMLISSGKITLDYPLHHVLELCDRLKDDEDFHVRKAVGWVLKCAYPTYKDEITKYLTENVDTMDRMIFRYALEHATKEEKAYLMSL